MLAPSAQGPPPSHRAPSANPSTGRTSTLRFGLKRGKLLYLFRYPHHDVEREKHRNVITRARYIKASLEAAGYTLIPWDFKKGSPPTFWDEKTMDEEDDDLYGPSESPAPPEQKKDDAKNESEGDDGDEPMDEGEESGESDDDEDESDSVRRNGTTANLIGANKAQDVEIIIEKPQTAPKPMV
jgi:pre-mRNA 3'-end-processing factor FIP1